MKDRHREAFETYAEEVTSDFETVEKVVLFGSVARGEHGVDSDVDVLVLVSDLSEREEIEDAAFAMTDRTGVSLTPVVLPVTKRNQLVETAEEEGVTYVRG